MKIAILGTRGIPNSHGGFEQFAEFFSVYLQQNSVDVSVYCSSNHPNKETTFKGVKRILCHDPEEKMGTVGQFIYDLNCIRDARKRNFDVILQLGYTSNSVWYFYLPKKSVIVTNMDGLEWKRTKYSKAVQRFLKFAEKLAVKHSDFLISDSIGIQAYLQKEYGAESNFIAYGATVFEKPNVQPLSSLQLQPYCYDLIIARMEPENNIETIIKGYLKNPTDRKLVIVGNYQNTPFGRYLFDTYIHHSKIRFVGAIYDMEMLDNVRYFSNIYFHGHSVGGTNPSLLEAMATHCCIVAHDNIFNRSILGKDALYFKNEDDLSYLLSIDKNHGDIQEKTHNNIEKIRCIYQWDTIHKAYLDYIKKCLQKKK